MSSSASKILGEMKREENTGGKKGRGGSKVIGAVGWKELLGLVDWERLVGWEGLVGLNYVGGVSLEVIYIQLFRDGVNGAGADTGGGHGFPCPPP